MRIGSIVISLFVLSTTVYLTSCATVQTPVEPVVVYDTEHDFWKPGTMPHQWGDYTLDEKKQLDEEIRSYYETIERVQPTAELYKDLGILLYKRCRLEEASEAFDRSIELDRYDPESFYLNACANFFAKRYDLTRKYLSRAKQLGFMVDPETNDLFRTTCPPEVDYYRARLRLDLEKPYSKLGLYVRSIEEVRTLADEEIDLATFALIVSKDVSETLYGESFDIELYQKKIDRMVVEILQMVGAETRPSWVSSVISSYLFKRQRFIAPLQDTADVMRPSYHLLNFVIDNRKGVCMSLAMLYLGIAERLKMPFYGVIAPGHFFVRYDDLVSSINIETTAFGKQYTNDHYRQHYPNLDVAETLYYKNLTVRETMGCYLNNIGTVYLEQKLYDKAINTLMLAIRMNPRFTEPYINLGNAYSRRGLFEKGITAYKEGLAYNERSSALLRNLGLAYISTGDYDLALEELKLSQAINPEDPQVYHFLGIAYNQKGLYDLALEQLSHALEYYPTSVDIILETAKAYYYIGNYTAAWDQVNKIRQQGQRVDPDFLNALRAKQGEYE